MAQAKIREFTVSDRKVDQKKLDAILADIRGGCPRKVAAEANGITETTFHNLVKQGLVDMAEGKDTLEHSLVVSLRSIEKDEIQDSVKQIKKGKYGHKGREWVLEKIYWRYFGGSAQARELLADMEELKNQLKEAADGKVNSSKEKKDPEE